MNQKAADVNQTDQCFSLFNAVKYLVNSLDFFTAWRAARKHNCAFDVKISFQKFVYVPYTVF
jgi:hypothetical protein